MKADYKIMVNLGAVDVRQALNLAERTVYEEAYKLCRYNQVQTAKILDVSRTTLRKKMKTYFGDKYIK